MIREMSSRSEMSYGPGASAGGGREYRPAGIEEYRDDPFAHRREEGGVAFPVRPPDDHHPLVPVGHGKDGEESPSSMATGQTPEGMSAMTDLRSSLPPVSLSKASLPEATPPLTLRTATDSGRVNGSFLTVRTLFT